MLARNYKPDIYLVGEPLFFPERGVYELKYERGVYELTYNFEFFEREVRVARAIQVASIQLYEWLNGNAEDAHLVFDLAAEKRDHLLSQ